MAYDQPEPIYPEVYVSYPEYYKTFINNEKKFKEFLVGYLAISEPTLIAVGVTSDHRLVCKPNPDNTIDMVNKRRTENKTKPKRGKK